MRIALDYDDTFTADRLFWSHFIGLAHETGQTVYMVTTRSFPLDNNSELTELSEEMSVIFCNGISKQEVMESKGIHIDIWIDDNPGSILYNSRMSPGELAEWRKSHSA